MKFSEQVRDFVQKTDMQTTMVYQRACKRISFDIATGTPVSTGRLLGSWSPNIGNSSSVYYAGGESAWNNGVKDKSIATQNRSAAFNSLAPRITSTTESLSKSDIYYFTNDTPYVKQAEHDGWGRTGAYHMRENAVLNWNAIVNTEIIKAKK